MVTGHGHGKHGMGLFSQDIKYVFKELEENKNLNMPKEGDSGQQRWKWKINGKIQNP